MTEKKNLFDKIEDAPPPSNYVPIVYVNQGVGWCRRYVNKDGKWVREDMIYPATID